MFKNYLKITFRNLWGNKTYSFLNIFGLAIGIACAGVIFLWVEDEVTFNGNHLKRNHIYQVMENWNYDGDIRTFSSTPYPMAPAMQKDIPGMARSCRTTEGTVNTLFTIGDRKLYAEGLYADSSLFDIFTLPFIAGDPATAFSQLNSIVLNERTAKSFFGTTENILGKTVLADNQQPFVVTGVVRDIPDNSSIQFDFAAPIYIRYRNSPGISNWDWHNLNTYVELAPHADVTAINRQLYNYLKAHDAKSISHPILLSMNDWRLRSNFSNGKQSGGRIEYVHLFSLIAWIILLVACINFMNLATARSEKRAKEVGVRKVMGAAKNNLVVQFIGEALLMALIAALVATGLVYFSLPAFNALVDKQLSLGLDNPLHLLWLLLITVICGVVSGSYPSLYLTSFNPVLVLKGIKARTGNAGFVRKGLVVTQFSISITLIICTIIIFQQIQYVKNRNLGFNKDNLIAVPAQEAIVKHFPAIKTALLGTGLVGNVALADHATIYGGNNTDAISWDGKSATDKILISQRLITPEYINTTGMVLKEGTGFKPVAAANGMDVIITESLEKIMGKGSAIGKILLTPARDSVIHSQVVGVVKDFVYGNMFGTPDPVVFYCIPEATNLLYIRMNGNINREAALRKIGDILLLYNPDYPFSYHFVDDQFNAMFTNETLMQQLSRLFATLAIIISCLGLFGLAAYTAERRTREIGIRKVLGASISNITRLLSIDFLKLVGAAALIAFPVAWYIMHWWLQQYPYRVLIHFWVFALAGLIAIFITLCTIGFQAIRAALMNPVQSLKAE